MQDKASIVIENFFEIEHFRKIKNFYELDLDLKNVSFCIDEKNRFKKWRPHPFPEIFISLFLRFVQLQSILASFNAAGTNIFLSFLAKKC